jgi:phosphatidylglycerophosphate synthase
VLTLAAGGSPRVGAARAGIALAVPLAAALLAIPFASPLAPLAGLVCFATVAILARDNIDTTHPHPRFGVANTVTLARAAGTALLAALALEPGLLAGSAVWAAVAGAVALLALDGVDGWIARRQGLVSPFGARFDMEVDTLLILVLAVLALGLGKAGPWVLGLGLMRYAFVLAGRAVPALRAELPPSWRRKAVCVVQIVVLATMLVPWVVPPASSAIGAGALVLLAWSFAVDVRWLIRTAR